MKSEKEIAAYEKLFDVFKMLKIDTTVVNVKEENPLFLRTNFRKEIENPRIGKE